MLFDFDNKRICRTVRHVSHCCVNEQDLRVPRRNRGRRSTTKKKRALLEQAVSSPSSPITSEPSAVSASLMADGKDI